MEQSVSTYKKIRRLYRQSQNTPPAAWSSRS